MTGFVTRLDIEQAGISDILTDAGVVTGVQLPAALNTAIPPILTGLDFKSDRYRVVTPDAGGNSAPLINARIAELSALGGGTLVLDSGGAPFVANSSIAAGAQNVSIVSRSSKGVISLQKGDTFPDGDTLLSCRGTGDSGNTGTSHISNNLLQGFALSGRSPNGTMKGGYLLDTSYTGGFRYDQIMLRRCGNTAWYREEEWDSVATDIRMPNCGGTTGASDAAMRIVSSTGDSSNNLKHYGIWWESFPHMFCSIEVGTNAGGTGPYNIAFHGWKAESIYLVANALTFQSSDKCRSITLDQGILGIGGVNTVGGLVTGIDLQGQNAICNNLNVDIRTTDFVSGGTTVARKPTVDWAIRATRSAQSAGSSIRDILINNSTASVNSIINLYGTNSGGGALDFQGALTIEGIRAANATWPMFSGTGWDATYGVDTIGVLARRLEGVPGTTQTGNITLRKGHASSQRPVGINNAGATTATIPQGLAAVGRVIEVVQEGAGAVTLTPFTGVTLDVPTGMSATTAGQGRSVRARCLATNAYRVISS